MTSIHSIFTADNKKSIVDAIAKLESFSSAELRVHIASKCKKTALDEASKVFSELKMHKTEDRSGVLIYLAFESKKCAIIGDVGINKKVERAFWEQCAEEMMSYFKTGDYTQGIVSAIEMSSVELTKYFPIKEGDVNELPNDISFEK